MREGKCHGDELTQKLKQTNLAVVVLLSFVRQH